MKQLNFDFSDLTQEKIQAKYTAISNEYQCLLRADRSYQFESDARHRASTEMDMLREIAENKNFTLILR